MTHIQGKRQPLEFDTEWAQRLDLRQRLQRAIINTLKKLKEILFQEYSNNEQIVNTKRRKLKESNGYCREEKHINGNEKYIVYTQTDLKW